jgi:hypothetical protein
MPDVTLILDRDAVILEVDSALRSLDRHPGQPEIERVEG